MLIPLFLLLLGLAFLIKGADLMVDGASALAKRHNISQLAIGLTIVAFGTSAPELVVNALASFQNHQDLVFGNVIGSNNFNLFMILGIAGMIAPITVQSSTVWKEIPISFFAIIVLFILSNGVFSMEPNLLSRLDGFLLLALFAGFLFYVYNQLKTETIDQQHAAKAYTSLKIWSSILVGLTLLVAGGALLVNNAVKLAEALGMSEKLIGLTIVAAGTSLPELATTVVASLKKNNDIAVGNIIGSNIFNVFMVIAVSAIVRPIEYDNLFNTDLYLLAGGTLFLFLAMFAGQKKKLDRWEAAILLIAYIIYTVYLIK